MSIKTILKQFVVAVSLVGLLGLITPAAADEKLHSDFYYTLPGLDGLGGTCCYDVPGNLSCGVDDDPGGCVDNSGEVGVSQFVTNDKALVMAGSIQPNYDDGRSCSCSREVQTYSIVDRSNQSFPGLTNTLIGLCLCSSSTGECNCSDKWSTMYAGPRLPEGSSVDSIADSEKDMIGIVFPETIGGQMLWHALAPSANNIQARYMAWLNTRNPVNDDIITVTQYVYKPDGKPYFDVTWKIETLKENPSKYDRVKFWHAADTYTGGNDFGYGYLCDVTKIAGGTGGSSFFQGTVAMHPSDKQFEGWWAAVFDKVKNDNLPTYEWSRPLGPAAVSEGVDLTKLDDNAIAHEWDKLSIGTDPQYISLRWTFDDPILQSTYGSTRSLFTVSSNDVSHFNVDGNGLTIVDSDGKPIEYETTPSLYDIRFNPNKWRGRIFSYQLPISCATHGDCTGTDQCLADKYCLENADSGDLENCPKFCAAGYASVTGCAAGTAELFRYCVIQKWKTEDMDNYDVPSGGRRVFTFDLDGNRIWFDPNNASLLRDGLGVATDNRAIDVIRWTLGSLNLSSDASSPPNSRKIIPENESNDYDLHRPLNPDALALTPPTVLEVMRERYDADESNRWLLGDIAHADPIYVGSRPSNSWEDVGPVLYSDFFNRSFYQHRKPVLIVASNDGMLHCYDAEGGEELWAFVPWDVLPKLVELSKPIYEQLRTPTMDLRPVLHDAYDHFSGEWRSVLIVGSRGGGDRYWAMEVTPRDNNQMHLTPIEAFAGSTSSLAQSKVKFLWQFGDDDLGLTYSVPTTGRFKLNKNPDDDQSEWLAVFGSGYAPTSAQQMQKEGFFYAVNVFDITNAEPKVVAKVRVSKNGGNDPPFNIGIAGMGDDEAFIRNNVLSSPTVMDNGAWDVGAFIHTADGFEDAVYIGDLAGHLLRFTFEPAGTGFDVSGLVLFNTFRMRSSGADPGLQLDPDYLQKVENKRIQQVSGATDDQTYEFYKYPRPISVRPVTWRTDPDPNDGSGTQKFLGKTDNYDRTMVFFGTGKYDAFYDSFDTFVRDTTIDGCRTFPFSGCTVDYQQFFGVIDYDYPNASDTSQVNWYELLPNQVNDFVANGVNVRTIDNQGGVDSGWRGWRIQLNSTLAENRGEKVITEPVIWEQSEVGQGGTNPEWTVFFTTWTPNMEGTCDIRSVNNSGGGYVMSVRATDGQSPSFAVQDINRDSMVTKSDLHNDKGLAGQKFTGSILSRVEVDPYGNSLYVKTGPDQPVLRVTIAGLSPLRGVMTTFTRVQ